MLVIDKPVDWTSFDVVSKIRRLTGIKKVGHAGTLDPFATGILLICLGPATKKSSQLMDLPKEYIAEIQLGSETDTMDVTGKEISRCDIPAISKSDVEEALTHFIGDIEQEIPAYSAAKFRGKRLYKLAREGKDVPQLFKHVHVSEIELLALSPEVVRIRVACGRGTYIRTLGRDIARKLNCAGHLKTLVRSKVGDYRVEDALSIDDFQRQLNQKTAEPPTEAHPQNSSEAGSP